MPSNEPPRFGTLFLLDFYLRRIADLAKLFEPILVYDALISEYESNPDPLVLLLSISLLFSEVSKCCFGNCTFSY